EGGSGGMAAIAMTADGVVGVAAVGGRDGGSGGAAGGSEGRAVAVMVMATVVVMKVMAAGVGWWRRGGMRVVVMWCRGYGGDDGDEGEVDGGDDVGCGERSGGYRNLIRNWVTAPEIERGGRRVYVCARVMIEMR
ncbi:hypothetical protein Tco_1158746, partial [Tanacetum coccineum]